MSNLAKKYNKMYENIGNNLSRRDVVSSSFIDLMAENLRSRISNNFLITKLLNEVEQNLKDYNGEEPLKYTFIVDVISSLLNILKNEEELNSQTMNLLDRFKQMKEETIV